MNARFNITGQSRRRRKVTLAWVALAAAASFALIGAHVLFAASPSASPPIGGKNVLRIGYAFEDIDSLNPFVGYSMSVYDIFVQNYDFLVEHRPEDSGPGHDGLAESWESSADGKTWIFHLRHNVKWQDGQDLTAADVVFTYNYIIDNELSAYSGKLAGVTKVKAVDDYTVKIVTEQPKADMLRLWIPILPEHVWAKIPPEEAGTTYQNNPPIVGSGPFQVVEFKRGKYVTLKANKDYFLGAPAVDEVVEIPYTNSSTMTADLIAGTIDAAQELAVPEFEKLQNTPGITTKAFLLFNWDYVMYNCYEGASSLGHPALRDPQFRRALDYAIDREKLVEVAYSGEATPGTSQMTPNCWSNPDYHWEPPADVLRTFDLDKARNLLDEAGYTDNDGDGVREYKGKPIKLRLWALTTATKQQAAAKQITGWFREIGLDVKLQVVEEGVYTAGIWNYEGNTYAPDFDMYLWTWYGYDDPGQSLNALTTAQIEGWNEPGWSNAEFDRLFELQSRELDVDKRAEYIKECQRVIYGDCVESVIAYPMLLQAYNTDKWTGWLETFHGNGPAFETQFSQKSLLNVSQRVAEEQKSSVTWVWAVAAAAAVAVCVFVAIVVRRRRRSEEEA
jgi:peptide/nickel transport system substrate-binding protein